MKKPKVAFFDLNHTCLQMGTIPKSDILEYLTHVRNVSSGATVWHPLRFPNHWRQLLPWNDAITAIHNFRYYSRIKCVTLSNNPIDVQLDQLRWANISFEFMVPLESYHVFKPNVKAYQVACNLLQVAPEDALMVTANHDFGDIEGAASIGMPSVWIDRKNEDDTYKIKNLLDLVKELE